MKKGNQLGWILAVGGIGLVGFYVFNKKKPTIATEQLSSIDNELGTIKSKSEEKPKTLDELASKAVADIQNMTEAERTALMNTDFSKIDFSSLKLNALSGLNTLIGNSYDLSIERMDSRVANEFPMPIPFTPTDAYVCIKLDVLLRDITLKIEAEQKKVLFKTGDQQYVNGLQRRKGAIESAYNSSSCPTKIEALRLNESAMVLTKGAIIQENIVTKKSNTDQQIFIGIGAVVALTGLYIVLKK